MSLHSKHRRQRLASLHVQTWIAPQSPELPPSHGSSPSFKHRGFGTCSSYSDNGNIMSAHAVPARHTVKQTQCPESLPFVVNAVSMGTQFAAHSKSTGQVTSHARRHAVGVQASLSDGRAKESCTRTESETVTINSKEYKKDDNITNKIVAGMMLDFERQMRATIGNPSTSSK